MITLLTRSRYLKQIKVTRSQRNGKDNAKVIYCPWVAGRRLMTGSILYNLKLEEYVNAHIKDKDQCQSTKFAHDEVGKYVHKLFI